MKGQITIVHMIGWGFSLALAVTGFMWTKIASTDGQVEEVKVGQAEIGARTSKLEEAVATIKDDNRVIKEDVKELLRRVK